MNDIGYGCFYVNGRYEDVPGFGIARVGQMYVEYRVDNPTQPYPIVFVHGGGSTGATWISTPDGRPGWAPWFVEQGFPVYMIDWPGCGRSAYYEPIYGPLDFRAAVPEMEAGYTDIKTHRLWPQAKLHSQWPGTGRMGDPTFDTKMDGRGSSGPRDVEMAQALVRDGLSALLDRIGPAIVFAHSAGGAMGWAIADARPDAVKGLVQLEPSGPPVYDLIAQGEDAPWKQGAEMSRPWGLTQVPLHYEPPINDAGELTFVPGPDPGRPDRDRGWLQEEPARQLVNMAQVPQLLICSEAARQAIYAHATSNYLTQAGVHHTYVNLGDVGIHGNGHNFMAELNNIEIAELVREWLAANVA